MTPEGLKGGTMALKNERRSITQQLKQFANPLYSTIGFEKFLNKHECFKVKSILDIGCACAAATSFMATKHPKVNFVGADYNKFLIKRAKQLSYNSRFDNMELLYGDLLNLPSDWKGGFNGIYSIHTICCFKNIKPVIESLSRLEPDWIAFNSLFYEGPLDVLIHIRDHGHPELKDDNPDGDFNIFSLPMIKKYFAKKGYKEFFYERFEIPKKLKRPPQGKRGTYTIRTEMSSRTQFSGPVYLPWYFVLARKRKA